ncbi:ABC transporter permease [Salipaludibacillus aurantiacus]|uniref:ABC-2 type transport system permease protein n=1 Tax=Salipaludibacillus aurantiacus TaxID=1601833 RepID=A0A1H9WE61_9BACI|nr:ABC transporter permease [Salipaludibacillus aurantiacus]SES32081.1 ABC-2 type transport system permease protein [Salipaludibacillus aurantiacus]
MSLFINLVQNESMKIFKKTGTKVMFLILIALIAVIGLVTRFFIGEPADEAADWETVLQQEVQMIEQQLESGEIPPRAAEGLQEQHDLYMYHLEEGIEPLNSSHRWYFIVNNPQFVNFLTMFTVIIAAGIIAGEHSNGTIKLLLIRPVKRWKILLSKWLAAMLFSLVMLATLIIFSVAAGFLIFGFSPEPVRVVEIAGGSIRDMHVALYGAVMYGLAYIELIIMTTFAFMIGTVFRNQSLAIGLSLVLLFTGGQIAYLLSNYNWMKFYLFANTYMIQFFEGQPIIEGLTPLFSSIVLIVYFSLFMLIAMVAFTKRDVAD